MADLPERIRAALSEAEITGIVRDLVSIPSFRGVRRQETGAAEYIHSFFSTQGIESALIPVKDGRCNVTSRFPGAGGGRSLLLTSHLDTVPPYGMADPCRLKADGGKLCGRGAADAKGVIACMIAALAALKRCGATLQGDLLFAGVIDEEEASAGTLALLKSGLSADAAVVGEPTGFDLCTGQRGLEWLEFRFHGSSVHGGSQAEGVNAILMASRFIERVERDLAPRLNERVHPLLGAASMNYGLIRGGSQPSTVAGSCILQIDRRWIPGEDYREVIKEYRDILDALGREDPRFRADFRVAEASVMEDGCLHQGMVLDPAHPLVGITAETVFAVTGIEPRRRAFTAWSDAGLLSYYGKIPSLIFAPGDLSAAHSDREYIEAADLVPAALIYALAAARFCA